MDTDRLIDTNGKVVPLEFSFEIEKSSKLYYTWSHNVCTYDFTIPMLLIMIRALLNRYGCLAAYH